MQALSRPAATDLSPRPDLGAPLPLLPLTPGSSSSPPSSARRYCSDWHGATFLLVCTNGSPNTGSNVVGFFFFLFFFYYFLSLPSDTTQSKGWRIFFLGKQWLFTRILYHQIALKKKNKRTRRSKKKRRKKKERNSRLS